MLETSRFPGDLCAALPTGRTTVFRTTARQAARRGTDAYRLRSVTVVWPCNFPRR
jgi:hypothetical protein